MASRLFLEDHIALSQNRWLTALMSDFYDRNGARYVELVSRLGISKDSLSRTLEAALALGWITKNAGYGHPLRPEYVLTGEGTRISNGAFGVLRAQAGLALPPASFTRWDMPILTVLKSGQKRFGEVGQALNAVTPRALSQGLQSLERHELLERMVIEARPPFNLYGITDSGLLLASAA